MIFFDKKVIPSHHYPKPTPPKKRNFILENIIKIKVLYSNNKKNKIKTEEKQKIKNQKEQLPIKSIKNYVVDSKTITLSTHKEPIKPVKNHIIDNKKIKLSIHEAPLIKANSIQSTVKKETNISEIDVFSEKLKNINVIYKNNDFGTNHKPKYLIKNHNKPIPRYNNSDNTIRITNANYLGKGEYGSAYRIGKFVIKIPHEHIDFKYNKHADYDRCSRILNDINHDINFSRVVTLNNGNQILVTQFIDGKSVENKKAFDFVRSQGRIIFDYGSKGNVREDKQGKLYLIDADFIAQPRKLYRTPSLGTFTIHHIYSNHFKKHPIKSNETKPLYYPEINYLLTKNK
ncbi:MULTISPECIES: hypothetical protein [Providencia]|uniref:hypothetical protein n=1 Tax=Providencia TaxID=586 RepID=UPI000838DCAC|nr:MULTISPECIES: hypothetical protein [Providencia]MBP6121691.1 hypothetical protein [Providencia sp.]NIH20777.1 hypothetical protein [Providencia heimbachae]